MTEQMVAVGKIRSVSDPSAMLRVALSVVEGDGSA